MSNNPQRNDDDLRAKEQAQSQLNSIKEMVSNLRKATDGDANDGDDACLSEDKAREAIQNDALSVEVRSGWTTVSDKYNPEEYKILLCTGGPAVMITGDLNIHQEPHTARLEYQDWFTPWKELHITDEDEQFLLEYAQQFYFGE